MKRRHWRWVTGMVDLHMPLLAEIRRIRAQLGADDGGEWRTLKYPLSPCLTSVLLAHDEGTAGERDDALSVFRTFDHLERLFSAAADPDRLRTAPVLDKWTVRRMDDGCPHLLGEVLGHTQLADGTAIFTSPYMRLDWSGGWARTTRHYYRLGRYDRGYTGFSFMG